MAGKLPGRSGRAGGKRYRNYAPLAEINVTPFVDVMLVLLIVFMVTAPLLTAGVPVDLPQSEARSIQEKSNEPIEITIDSSRNLYIGEAEIQKEKLIPILRAMTKGNPDRRIFIRGDQSIDYGVIMKILGSVNSAGFKKVSLISAPPQ